VFLKENHRGRETSSSESALTFQFRFTTFLKCVAASRRTLVSKAAFPARRSRFMVKPGARSPSIRLLVAATRYKTIRNRGVLTGATMAHGWRRGKLLADEPPSPVPSYIVRLIGPTCASRFRLDI
jgi:hypothetical protein